MKLRWMVLGVAIGLVLTLTVGFAFASGRPPTSGPGVGKADHAAAMEAMHDSPTMQRMHAEMPEEIRAQCEAMHEQVDEMMQRDGGALHGDMSTGGTMDGSDMGGMMGTGAGGMMGS